MTAVNGCNATNKTTAAFLGPFGTYSHQAAHEYFNESVELVEKKTISDVFKSLGEVDFGVIPQENTIYGPVVETYDELRTLQSGFIRGEIILPVQHCLFVQKGVKLAEIDCVMSHEQALGQCKGFIAKHLPHVQTNKTASTAAAAEILSSSLGSKCAAVCSKMALKMFDGLEVLGEGIQDEKSNYTRFYILANDSTVTPPHKVNPREEHTLLRIQLPAERGGIAVAIQAFQLEVTRIDRRPAPNLNVFDDLYFVEVFRGVATEDKSTIWANEVHEAVKRVRVLGGEVHLLGMW